MTMEDAQLIEKFLNGDHSAFNTLVWRWEKPVFHFNYRYLGDFELAKDITQKVFIRIYKNLKKLKEHQKFTSWMYQIAANLCKDEIKRIKRQNSVSIDAIKENNSENVYDLVDHDTNQPDTKVNQQQIEHIIKQALQSIPEEQRIVIIMKEYQGLKFKEIAEALGEPINTVKSRMYYGLNALRKVFVRWNLDEEVLRYEM